MIGRCHLGGKRLNIQSTCSTRRRLGWRGLVGLFVAQPQQLLDPDLEQVGQAGRGRRRQCDARGTGRLRQLVEFTIASGYSSTATEGLVPRQRLFLCAEQLSQRHAFSHTAHCRLGPSVEPDVAESKPQRAVVQQQTRATDVIMVDVRDDEQIDVAPAVSVGR